MKLLFSVKNIDKKPIKDGFISVKNYKKEQDFKFKNYLFYKVYTDNLKPKEALQYLERYNPSYHIFNPTRYFSTKKLQESEIGKIIQEFSKNPDNFTGEYLENIIALIARKRKEIEERLKYWFEDEIYKELIKIEEELKRESCKSGAQEKSSKCL